MAPEWRVGLEVLQRQVVRHGGLFERALSICLYKSHSFGEEPFITFLLLIAAA